MKKKITAIALVVCLVAVAIVGGSLAYFTDTDAKTNTFTVGNVAIALSEDHWNPNSTRPPQVYPGEVLTKDPVVTNTGANPCFVRIQVTGLNCLGDAGNIVYLTNGVENALGTGWTFHDGYFYYTEALEGGEETTALFDSIQIPTGLTNDNATTNSNDDATTNFNVVVTAYAVQAEGITMAGTEPTVAEIAAWFTTCGM